MARRMAVALAAGALATAGMAGTGAARAEGNSDVPLQDPQTSAPPQGSATPASPSREVAVSGSRTRRQFAVVTPDRGQTTIIRMLVSSRSRPTIAVERTGSRTGAKGLTVVGGAKRLARHRYAVTVPIIKPRVKGASSRAGELRVSVAGKQLRVRSRSVLTDTFTRQVRGEMCRAVSPFDIANHDKDTRIAFQPKVLFGKAMAGFRHPQYVGSIAVLQACTGQSPQTYMNALSGVDAAAVTARSLSASAATSPIDTSPGSGDAVVLVSGFMSQTPFTTPGAVCSAPNMSAGGTWYALQTSLANAGVPVYTVPETEYDYSGGGAPVPVAIDPAEMGLGSCAQTQLPASMTMNTAGDFDINSSILANYLNYINENFGVERVWLVGHSDGGLWSRGAMDYASFMPGIQIQSITTIDTPYTGSFLADLGEYELTDTCGALQLECQLDVAALNEIVDHFATAVGEGAALNEMTSDYMAEWNQRLAGIPGETPFYAASAIGINDPRTFNYLSSGTGDDPFYNPNDIAVGLSSAQADGLVENGTISVLRCFPTVPGLHTEVPGKVLSIGQDVDLINSFPGSSVFPNSTTAVTINPMVIEYVSEVLAGNPPTQTCPSAGYEQSGQFAPGQFGSWPDS